MRLGRKSGQFSCPLQLQALATPPSPPDNSGWCRVKRGVAYAKEGKHAEAIKCYDQALSIDAKHVDAYVARGAA